MAVLDIVTDQVQVHGSGARYEVAGTGEPVVLIHGLAGSSRWWRPILPALAVHHRVYMVDLPGFGSMSRTQRFALDAAVPWLVEWMDATGLHSADIVGHSLGGQLSLRL